MSSLPLPHPSGALSGRWLAIQPGGLNGRGPSGQSWGAARHKGPQRWLCTYSSVCVLGDGVGAKQPWGQAGLCRGLGSVLSQSMGTHWWQSDKVKHSQGLRPPGADRKPSLPAPEASSSVEELNEGDSLLGRPPRSSPAEVLHLCLLPGLQFSMLPPHPSPLGQHTEGNVNCSCFIQLSQVHADLVRVLGGTSAGQPVPCPCGRHFLQCFKAKPW